MLSVTSTSSTLLLLLLLLLASHLSPPPPPPHTHTPLPSPSLTRGQAGRDGAAEAARQGKQVHQKNLEARPRVVVERRRQRQRQRRLQGQVQARASLFGVRRRDGRVWWWRWQWGRERERCRRRWGWAAGGREEGVKSWALLQRLVFLFVSFLGRPRSPPRSSIVIRRRGRRRSEPLRLFLSLSLEENSRCFFLSLVV